LGKIADLSLPDRIRLATRDRPAAPAISARVRARGAGWHASEVVCTQGPHDRAFEERHGDVCLGIVLAGSFQYRSSRGSALLYPGAILLGDVGSCFECGHPHGSGDRCLAVHFDGEYFAEIAASTAGPGFRLAAPMLPALRELVAPLASVQSELDERNAAAAEIAAVRFAEAVLGCVAGRASAPSRSSARDQRRISAVIRHIEEHAHEALDLDRLAALACMSKYHFLRNFQRTTGLTPYQWLIGQRLRQSALALRRSAAPIAGIAFDNGFGDLSTFNATFRKAFGSTPGEFRRRG
jgi:AraC-like DNA-binding protein